MKKDLEVRIRKLGNDVIYKLDLIAKKKGISREELCRRILTSYVISPMLFETEEKYAGIVEAYTESIKNVNERLEELIYLIDREKGKE